MFDLTDSARRLYHRLLGHRPESAEASPGTATTADGASAVAAVEATICDPFAAAAGGRAGLAAALGRAAAGRRATAFLSGGELASALDLLSQATRRRIPLVVHLTTDGGHEAYHAAAATGAALFFAADVQEAVDLTLLARRLAEDALAPAIVAIEGPETARAEQDLELPPPDSIRRFLGKPDETVHPPTPSQEMLFGRHRRRLPRWHDPERPLLHGAALGPEALAPAAAARRVCFEAHLPELLERTREAFVRDLGRGSETLSVHRADGARLLLVAQGAAVARARTVADSLRSEGVAAGVVGLGVLRPFPDEALAGLLDGRRGVVVLERAEAAPLSGEIRPLLDGKEARLTTAVYGLGGAALRDADLAALVRELAGRDADRPPLVFLGLDMAGDGAYPKLEAVADALRRDYPDLARLGVRGDEAREEAVATVPHEPSPAVRRMGKSATPMADLPGFWDRVGVLYRDGRSSALLPDPFLATTAVPPLSSALRDLSPGRGAVSAPDVPAFDPALCTGCGACWTACPDNALTPAVVDPDALLAFAMEKAGARGRSVDKLRMVASKLASRVRREMAAESWNGGPAGPLFDAALDTTLAKMKLPEERKTALREAYAAAREEIAELPVARTGAFFDAAGKGGGDLFALALNPDACKGCGLCIEVCEPAALAAPEEGDVQGANARELWNLCEELPAPSAAVLERAREHPDAGPMAGALLALEAREVMAGGHGAEPGSGQALALRQILGAAAFHLRPRVERQLAEIGTLAARLGEAIHQSLADALPDRDLDSLARGLDGLKRPDADLAELTARVETAFDDERVDVTRTRRLVEAARALADLEWRWKTGEGGLGRAPLGLVIDGSEIGWAAAFPDNPFRVPATVDATGTAADVARGLAAGQRAETVDAVRAIRRARLELDRPAAAARVADELEGLGWRDLTDDERLTCPPLFLVTSDAVWKGPGLAALLALLAAEESIRVIVLCDPAAEDGPGFELMHLLEAVAKETFFVQSSVACPDHLEQGLADALDHEGPALLRLLAPSPARHGRDADATLDLAREQVESGAFRLLRPEPSEVSVGRAVPAEEPASPITTAGVAEPAETGGVAALEQQHDARLAALAREYEARLASQRDSLRVEMAQQVRARLMRLATGRRPAADRDSGEAPR